MHTRPDRAHARECAGLVAHTLVLKAQGFAVDDAHARTRLQVGGPVTESRPAAARERAGTVAQVCADLLEQLDQNMFADISGLPAAHRNLYMTVRSPGSGACVLGAARACAAGATCGGTDGRAARAHCGAHAAVGRRQVGRAALVDAHVAGGGRR